MVELHEILEGSSSSSSTQAQRYDVFLSFRGLDTRNSFTAYLHKALMDANINTFLDDEEIETGEDLKPELESAIKASRASVIILSKNYANSTWCLDELVLILEQRKTSNHIVIPIFYHVKPTHVRKQESSFGDAMTKHKQMMEAETNANKRRKSAQKIDRWTKALVEVANIKGMDLNGRQEMAFIEEIVTDIYRRLHISSRSHLPQLFGMDYSIRFVTSWLRDTSSHTADVLTILGIGGIGKTSLAKYVYGLYSHEFDTNNIIEDISRRCEKTDGLLALQKQLYNGISKQSPIHVHDSSVYTSMIENALVYKKMFLVLDDINSLDQLDALLGSKGLHPGSKIIITTKDAWLTESCVLFKTNVKPKHTNHVLKGLYKTESQKLLCYHAFMCNDPKVGYEEVSEKLVEYCEGHPMALQLLGKNLHNRDVAYWEGYIEELKKENGSPINNVLRRSFDTLPFKNHKDLFKHIACFFVGMDRDVAETILKACDIDTRSGITDLINRCLVSIGLNNELMMHRLVQEMGRLVVREESPDKPWERSRLWCHEDSFKVMKQKKGTENVLGLALDMRMLEKEKLHGSLELKTDALSKMDSLMLLQLNYVQITGSYKNFPKELRWLSILNHLGVVIAIPRRLHKRLKQLTGWWSKDKRLLGSLKILNLSFCEQLHSLGGFDHLPKLERLILRGCIGLLDVCESIEQCFELVLIDLSYCNKLEKLSRSLHMLKKVKTLLLNGYYLGESQIKIRDMDSLGMLKANNIGINTITSSSVIQEVIPRDLKFFAVSLPKYLVSLSLKNNNLSTESFPVDFSCLSMLKELYLDGNPIVCLPNCVRSLPRLETLSMKDCNMLTTVEHPPHTLAFMDLSFDSNKPLLRRVVFDPEMSPLIFIINWKMLTSSSCEIQGLIKSQPMSNVSEKVLRSLGWSKLNFLNARFVKTDVFFGGSEESEIQMYYEFGIFSIIYGHEEMPDWIMDRSTGPSTSFTIPSSPNNLTGLNFCYILTSPFPDERFGFGDDVYLRLPVIIINNITKKHTWIYEHNNDSVLYEGGKCLMFLSHWMFGMNDMESGDHITVSVMELVDGAFFSSTASKKPCHFTKECGVSFVYDDGEEKEEEGEDVLGYYKSWNHIIGGDLTGFHSVEKAPALKMTKCTSKLSLKEGLTYRRLVLKCDFFWISCMCKTAKDMFALLILIVENSLRMLVQSCYV
ncbi:unnamed protein product [Lactuca saligna]|uniref:TIR domain-containing protein n=1 Tax=Lactuca saligna TaxID=75948 RepID=A0AA35Y6Z1_LACSI|nr:unnamed protein product [Lactuca saligna]